MHLKNGLSDQSCRAELGFSNQTIEEFEGLKETNFSKALSSSQEQSFYALQCEQSEVIESGVSVTLRMEILLIGY